MAIYRRADSPWYWVSVSVGGHRFRRCTETDDATTARAVEARLRHDLIFENIAGQKPRITLDRACGFYWQNHAADLPTADDIAPRLKSLLKGLGGDTDLNRLTDAAIAMHITRRRGAVSRHGRPLSPASINREISTLRAVIRSAAGRLGIEAPTINWRAHWLREPEARSRYLTPDEARRLIACAASHLKAPIEFALLTGLRLGPLYRPDRRKRGSVRLQRH